MLWKLPIMLLSSAQKNSAYYAPKIKIMLEIWLFYTHLINILENRPIMLA